MFATNDGIPGWRKTEIAGYDRGPIDSPNRHTYNFPCLAQGKQLPTDPVQRRLAAILAADMVGYSRLMGAEEENTLAALTAHLRDHIEPAIAEHRGRVVKTTGDGLLAEFASVVDAVRCAIAVQDGMAGRNANASGDRRIDFRIGINLGDVIVQEGNVFGDGVNIAARLEGLAEPGGIVVSDKVYNEVRTKLDLGYEDLGPQQVKNIAEPVRCWRVGADTEPADSPPPLPDKPSIAVLPFNNMSGDPEQEYFSDGITEDIITDLSKISALFVIARNSSFTFKGKTSDVKHVARDLGVRYVLEGSVRKAAKRVRITAQMVDGTTGGHLWAERYDRDLDDIFAIQDEITQKIVGALRITLKLGEQERVAGRATSSMEAYDLALRARELVYCFNPEAYAEAAPLFEKAIALDPAFITPYWGWAAVLYTEYLNGWNDATPESLEKGLELSARAIEIDPEDPQGHSALALGRLWSGDLDGAMTAIDRAVELGPGNSYAFAIRGNVLSYAGRAGEAIASLDTAMRLNPHYPNIWMHFLGLAHFIGGDYEDAASVLARRLRIFPGSDISRALRASCLGHLGRHDEAREEWARVLEITPDYSAEQKVRMLPYADPADGERVIEGLREAGLTD